MSWQDDDSFTEAAPGTYGMRFPSPQRDGSGVWAREKLTSCGQAPCCSPAKTGEAGSLLGCNARHARRPTASTGRRPMGEFTAALNRASAFLDAVQRAHALYRSGRIHAHVPETLLEHERPLRYR